MSNAISQKVLSSDEIDQITKNYKKENKKIVFTNGCFDILHLGHVDYLEKARNLGDKLVLGLNTDDSVSRFKGPNRPIQDETSRARILAAFQFIDLKSKIGVYRPNGTRTTNVSVHPPHSIRRSR